MRQLRGEGLKKCRQRGGIADYKLGLNISSRQCITLDTGIITDDCQLKIKRKRTTYRICIETVAVTMRFNCIWFCYVSSILSGVNLSSLIEVSLMDTIPDLKRSDSTSREICRRSFRRNV